VPAALARRSRTASRNESKITSLLFQQQLILTWIANGCPA